MASMRGADVIWSAATVNDNDVSDGSIIGVATNVALFIKVSGANASFVIQAAYNTSPAAGGNALPTDDALWFDWLPVVAEELADSVTPNGIAITSPGQVCVELSPFSPPYLRLKVLSATNAVVSAFVASVE